MKHAVLFCSLLLSGLSAGIGFANAIGYMPAFADSPAPVAISFWQHADHYFRARMPIFGNVLLLTLVATLVVLHQEWQTWPFWLVAIGLLLTAGDIFVIVTENLPINRRLVTWSPENVPRDFEQYRQQALRAFTKRSGLSILAFVCLLSAAYLRTKK